MYSKSCKVFFLQSISCSPAGLARGRFSLPPQPAGTMIRIWDIATDLARVGKGYTEIKEVVEMVYGGKSLKKNPTHAIASKMKNGENTDN